jgi:hypothetical protein
MDRTQKFGFQIVKLEDRIAPSVSLGVLGGLVSASVSGVSVGSASASVSVAGLVSAGVTTPAISL